MFWVEIEEEKLICGRPTLPFLVVIRITPFCAWLPYNAAAEAPSRTDMLAMSSGFRLEIPSPPSGVPPKVPPGCPLALEVLVMGIPSITYKGWLLPLADRLPRRITLAEPPTPEALGEMVRPATLPLRLFIRLSVFTLVSC